MQSVNCLLIPFNLPENANPVTVEADFDGENVSLMVIRLEGSLKAYRNVCPHQGRRLDYAPGKFLCRNGTLICAAHGAVFAMDSGRCLQGPCAGESLVSVPVDYVDGYLRIYQAPEA